VYSLPFVRVEGNRFVDESGRTLVFRGVSIADPDRLERIGKWNKTLFEVLKKDWNANIVRIPVHPQAWRERGEAAYLKLLDQAVAWANELQLYLIIDWHSIGNLRTELFQHPMYNTTKTETFRFWKTIAAHFRHNPIVAFYELFNEPTHFNGTLGRMSWKEYKAIIEEL
jgi:endoglucanase